MDDAEPTDAAPRGGLGITGVVFLATLALFLAGGHAYLASDDPPTVACENSVTPPSAVGVEIAESIGDGVYALAHGQPTPEAVRDYTMGAWGQVGMWIHTGYARARGQATPKNAQAEQRKAVAAAVALQDACAPKQQCQAALPVTAVAVANRLSLTGMPLAIDAARKAGFTGEDLVTAGAVAAAESSLNPTATNRNRNGSVDHGLFQINDIHRSILAGGDWRDPYNNAQMARQVFADAGDSWSPWMTWKHGSHRKFLPQARAAARGALDTPSVPRRSLPGPDCTPGNVSGAITLVAELNPHGAGNWQAPVHDGNLWYVSQATAGDQAQIIHRLDASGRELDQMTLPGFAHAQSFAVIGGQVYASKQDYDIVTFPYRAGATVRDGKSTGWRGFLSKDPDGPNVVIRNGNKYQAFNLATKQPVGRRVVTPTGQRQGFSISGATVYVLTGSTNKAARVDAYSTATGEQIGTRDITGVGYKAGESGTFREPEGMYGNLIGVKVHTGDKRRLRVFRIDSAKPVTPAGLSSDQIGGVRSVRSKGRMWQIPIPKGPRGVAMNFMLDQIEQGDRYVFGAKGPDTWDCSSLISGGYRKAGISVYPQSGVMNRTLKHVPLSEAQPGDIFWHPGHVQLYAGRINGKRVVIEAANPRDDLRIDDSGWGKIDAVLRPTEGIPT